MDNWFKFFNEILNPTVGFVIFDPHELELFDPHEEKIMVKTNSSCY